VHELTEFFRLILAELVDCHLLLLLFDSGVLFLLRFAWESLPWQRAFQEVQQDMSDALEVISSGLLITDMSVDAGVSCSTCQVLSVSEGNVFAVGGLITFGQSKVNNKDGVLVVLIAAHQKIVGFDVTMNDALFMDLLDSCDHLDSNVEHSLQIELALAILEEVFKTLA
jgi:hypothetical protein